MANSNFNPFANFNTFNGNNGDSFMLPNGFDKNDFTPPTGNFDHDTSSNANMPFGLPPNLDLSAFFSNPGGMFSMPIFGQNQPSTLARGFDVDANAKGDVKDDVGDGDGEEDEIENKDEGEVRGESIRGPSAGKTAAEILRHDDTDVFKIITVCNLQQGQDPRTLFTGDEQEHIVRVDNIDADGSRDYKVFFDSRQAQNKAFKLAIQKYSTLADPCRVSVHEATRLDRRAEKKAARVENKIMTATQDEATKVTRDFSKTPTEAKADELRARLLAMKVKTPQPAVIMPPKPTSTSTSTKAKAITIGKTTLPREVDKLIEEGRAAAASKDKNVAVQVHESQLPTSDFALPKHKEDGGLLESVAKTTEDGSRATPASSGPAADEVLQYSKLRALSERLDTPSRPSKSKTTDSKMSIQKRQTSRESPQTSPVSAKIDRRHPPKRFIDSGSMSRHNDSNPNKIDSNQQIITARHFPHQVPSDGLEEGEVRTGRRPISTAILSTSPPALHTTESQNDNYYDDLETWLELTGYHDVEYRGRLLARQRKKQELQAQLEELEREAQTERVYTPTIASIPDVKIPVKTLMAPPLPPPARSTTISRITTETVSPVELPEGSGTSSNPRKRSHSERADSVMDDRTSKSHKPNQRPVSCDNRPVARDVDTSPSSSRYEPLERRISFSHNRQNSSGRDNRYYGGDRYKPHPVNYRGNRQHRYY